jgi:hypothetical protein
MDTDVARRIARLQYAAVRLPLTLLDEGIVVRYWDRDAFVRVGFERWLGSLDLLAGRLLADDEISRRGQALIGRTRAPAQVGGHSMDASAQSVHTGQVPSDLQAEVSPADDQTTETRDQIAAYQEHDDPQHVQQADDGPVTAGNASPAADGARISDAVEETGQHDAPNTSAAGSGTVNVTFTLPADVPADTVALCGEFNEWSADDIRLERGSDGSWRATVPLEPGRSYRYRYLLDGQRWENDRRADRYVPNPLGSTDSVIVVESPASDQVPEALPAADVPAALPAGDQASKLAAWPPAGGPAGAGGAGGR